MVDYLALTKFVLTMLAVGFVICRLAEMSSRTRRSVRQKYTILGVLLIFSLVAPIEWSTAIQCLGLVLFLSYGDKRRNLWHPKSYQKSEPIQWPTLINHE